MFYKSVLCEADHVCCTKADEDRGIFWCTCRKSWSGPGGLHFLPCVGQHVVTFGFVDKIPTRLRGFDQLLVIHYIEQVGRMDEGKTNHCQQLGQMLWRHREKMLLIHFS